jgi:hypothetical protein
MAPSFDQLSDHDFDPEDDEIDFSDLQERYEVHMEQGLDTFVVCIRRPTEVYAGRLITSGYRRPPSRQRRTETETRQISTQKIKHSRSNKRC